MATLNRVLILPPGHYQEINKPRRPRGKERWVIGIGGVMTAVIVALILFSFTSHRPKNGEGGCLSFTYAMVMGGEEFHACGQYAQDLCTNPPKLTSDGGLANDFKFRLRIACREANLGSQAAS